MPESTAIHLRPAGVAAILVCACGCRVTRLTPPYMPVGVRDKCKVKRCPAHGALSLKQILDLGIKAAC